MRILPNLTRMIASTAVVLLSGAGLILAQGADACGVCHRDLHKEWLQSQHSQAWKSESFQAQLKAFGSPEFCGRCHAPRSVWQEVNLELVSSERLGVNTKPDTKGFKEALEKEPTVRTENLEDGVSCGSCHYVAVLWPGGKSDEVLGPYHSEASHTGKESAAFQTFQLCTNCHGRAPQDYLPSRGAGEGFHHLANQPIQFVPGQSDCGTCHMPPRQDTLVQLRVFKNLPTRRVGQHTFSGRRYEQLEEALQFGVANGSLMIRNQGMGHAPKISADTEYLLRISAGDKSQEVVLEGISALTPGESLAIPLEVSGPGLSLEFVRLAPNGFQETLFKKALE